MILTTAQKAQLARLPAKMAANVLAIWTAEFEATNINPWGAEAAASAAQSAAYASLQSEGCDSADISTPDAMERD